MSGMKEIREHIASIQSTQKVTNAMYLIASTKMRRAKEDLDKARPFFDTLADEIGSIFRHAGEIDSPYLCADGESDDAPGTYAYLVVTADRGLAGAYNQNVIQETMKRLEKHPDSRLFVVGGNGRHFFKAHGVSVEESFHYSAQSPTLQRAREITARLLHLFDRGEITKIFMVYTDCRGVETQVRTARLLPLESGQFTAAGHGDGIRLRYEPSPEEVLAKIVPAYLTGFLYAAMVDSFCAEQNARAALKRLGDEPVAVGGKTGETCYCERIVDSIACSLRVKFLQRLVQKLLRGSGKRLIGRSRTPCAVKC